LCCYFTEEHARIHLPQGNISANAASWMKDFSLLTVYSLLA
jgi:hypothetical protein